MKWLQIIRTLIYGQKEALVKNISQTESDINIYVPRLFLERAEKNFDDL